MNRTIGAFRSRWLIPALSLLMLLTLILPAHARQGTASTTFERWYVVNMGGEPAGYLHAQESVENGNLVDRTQMVIEIRRGELSLKIEMNTRFVETPDGKPIEAVNVQKLSQMTATTTLKFHPDKIIITTEQGQQKTERSVLPPTQPWMTPVAMARYIADELAAGKKQIKTWSIEASLGPEPFETTLNVLGKEVVPVMGRRVEATVLETSSSRMPGVTSRVYADEQGRAVKMKMGMGGIELEVVQADKAIAQTPINPPQLLASMLITPKGKIESPRQLRQGVYELKIGTMPDGSAVPLPEAFLPRGSYQKVVWSDDSTVRVVVDLNQPVEPGKDLPTEADRAPSPMLNSNDPRVKQLASQALKNVPADASPAVKAEALRKFVYQYISKKDLSVGFASASEVARDGKGDCTEHAVLLAALLRTQGLASRTVSGLVYADNFEGHDDIFGYHMWTRVWIPGSDSQGGSWIDLDATLSSDHPFDATHIALGISDLSQGVIANDMLVLAPVMGRLQIEVVR